MMRTNPSFKMAMDTAMLSYSPSNLRMLTIVLNLGRRTQSTMVIYEHIYNVEISLHFVVQIVITRLFLGPTGTLYR